jgi:hypothetical protein
LSLLINNANQWAFVHIPKTGGTTITNIISNQEGTQFITAHDSVRMVPDDYFIFTFVRNPFTRLTSAWQHGVRKNKYSTSFSHFLKTINLNDLWILPQSYYFSAGKTDAKKINFVGKYEEFTNDAKVILNKINVDVKYIPHLNRNPIYDNHPSLKQEKYYKSFYTEEWMKDWVRDNYKDDFKIFNYDMDI